MASIRNLTIEEYSILKVALSEVIDEHDSYMNNNLIHNDFKRAEYWRRQKEIAEDLLNEVERSILEGDYIK